MTTLMERHMEKLQAAEDAEVAVYRAVLAWAPFGSKAAEAKARLARAEAELSAAHRAVEAAIYAVSLRDVEMASDLAHLHNAGRLTRENVGDGGGRMIAAVLDAAKDLERATATAEKVKGESGSAHLKRNQQWAIVLRAYRALTPLVTYEVADAVALAIAVDTATDADIARVTAACQERLGALGLK